MSPASLHKSIFQSLKDIQIKESDSLRSFVASQLLESDDIPAYISDILTYGCVSGCVGSLVYTIDTHAFYDQFYHEIEQLRFEYEEAHDSYLKIKGDLKNFLAWFAFESVTYRIAHELGIL